MTQALDEILSSIPSRLPDEITKQLFAPIPPSEIQTKKQGGATIRFTSDKFVMHRLDGVVGADGWEDNYESIAYTRPVIKVVGRGTAKEREIHFLGVTTCRLTVLGVTKAGQADIEFENDMYGTPSTNAQARAFKRAAMKFGIAAELWDKEHVGSDDDETPRGKSSYSGNTNNRNSQAPSNNGGKAPSEAQLKYITGNAFSVPMAVAKQLTGGRDGTASALIEGLKDEQAKLAKQANEDAYDEDPNQFIARVLKKIAPNLIPLLNEDTEGDDEDED